MAMNRKEQAQLEAAEQAARLNRALRWSDYEEGPDIPAPEGGTGAHTQGWAFNARREDATVYEAWSQSWRHGSGRYDPDAHGGGSQGSIDLYSTKARALGALRRELERRAAETLARVDDEIGAALLHLFRGE